MNTTAPALTIASASAIVRANMFATEVTPDDADEVAQFEADYGTDEGIQEHVLDWAYMFEEPTPEQLAEDPEYAEFIAAWKFIMANGVHPKA